MRVLNHQRNPLYFLQDLFILCKNFKIPPVVTISQTNKTDERLSNVNSKPSQPPVLVERSSNREPFIGGRQVFLEPVKRSVCMDKQIYRSYIPVFNVKQANTTHSAGALPKQWHCSKAKLEFHYVRSFERPLWDLAPLNIEMPMFIRLFGSKFENHNLLDVL